jgi:hypothetical protein
MSVCGDSLDPDLVLGSEFTTGVAGIDRPGWLHQHDQALGVRKGLVLHAPRNHHHLRFAQLYAPVPKVDAHTPVDDDEDLVGVSVAVPDKISLYPGQFEVIVVHLGDDPGGPVLREQGEFRVKVDGLHIYTSQRFYLA